MDRQKEADPFHESEAGDIYDLYNACHGIVLSNGLLDISKLDEFSTEEAEALNVPRLREIWHHTETGCPRCASIISALDTARRRLKERAEVSSDERSKTADTDITNLISQRNG
ncbi:MAG TPA: hypothetical protein VGV59_12790 [Pyrinomonadaceae bacterium]|nr:hypothetical protein [Pyrinomonadaceae bacterium]